MMYEFGQRLQDHLRQTDKKAEVLVFGGHFRAVALNEESSGAPDYLIISKRFDLAAVKQEIRELGGNSKHGTCYPPRREFQSTRHFTVDQGALELSGEVAFASRSGRKDLEARVLRPTKAWALRDDPARGEHPVSATLCGRTVRLANLTGFKPIKMLAAYIAAEWQNRCRSRSFRYHATKISESAIPTPPAFIAA